MAVPVCPDCGTTIEPDWDWCHACGFDPEGVRPAAWSPATGALTVFPPTDTRETTTATAATAAVRERGDGAGASAGPSPHPLDLLRPPAAGVAPLPAAGPSAGPLTGPLVAPEPEAEHRPLTLDDLRRSTPPAASRPPVTATPDLDERPAATATDARPPLFPAPNPSPAAGGIGVDDAPERPRADTPVADTPAADIPAADAPRAATPPAAAPAFEDRLDDREVGAGEAHPYFDLPYDEPSAAPGSEPEPEPTSRLRRRKSVDARPNAASMAMAAGRIPSDGAVLDAPPTPTSSLPPPPAAVDAAAAPDRHEPVDDAPTAPDGNGSLGPIVFGQPGSPLDTVAAKPAKAKSSPLSVVAILMTIAIAVIVLWPTYQNLVDSEATPALPPPSAGPIGYAPAQADGSRAAVDPQRTSSWATSAPAGAGYEIDMPGVVVIRTPSIPVAGGTAESVVASSSTGRGGYVVAAVDAPSATPWTTVQQAADAILDGFDDVAGNDLTVGPSTTVGGLPALTVEGTVDGVPSKGAVVLVGNRAYLAVAGNASAGDLDRFLSSFQTVP